MSQIPQIDEENRRKPLTYNPRTNRFITYDEIIEGKAQIVPLETLTQPELTNLVIERQRVGPDYKMSDLNGKILRRDQIIEEIRGGTDFGKMLVQAEISYLKDFLNQIRGILATNP